MFPRAMKSFMSNEAGAAFPETDDNVGFINCRLLSPALPLTNLLLRALSKQAASLCPPSPDPEP